MHESFKHNKDRKEKQFWISPDGKICKIKGSLNRTIISFHREIAVQLFPNLEYPDDFLMKTGWIMVGSSCYNCPIIHAKPTQSQINVLFDLDLYSDLCFLYKNLYPNYEKYKALCD